MRARTMPGKRNLPGESTAVLRQNTGSSHAPAAPAPFHCVLARWARGQRGLTTDPISLGHRKGCFSQISPAFWRAWMLQQAFSIPPAKSAIPFMGNTFPVPFKYCASYLVCGGQVQVLAIGTLLQVWFTIDEFPLFAASRFPFCERGSFVLACKPHGSSAFFPLLHFDLCCHLGNNIAH